MLHYNWVDYLDSARRGGGVSVYQRATIEALSRRDTVQTTFLCAGLAQSLRPGRPRWERLPCASGDPTRRFQMVDTLPLSPAHHAFGSPEQVDHRPSVEVFARFLAEEGPFDVVQFNTMEGLPASVLALRERFPATRFVVALHNYYPFCPQVNLWYREHAHCDDFANGRACVSCLPVHRDPKRLRRLYGAVRALETSGIRRDSVLYRRMLQPAARMGAALVRKVSDQRRAKVAQAEREKTRDTAPEPATKIEDGTAFAQRRTAFADHLNAYADCVLAVSHRTADIARGFDIDPAKVIVRYIGTDQAGIYATTPSPKALPRADGTLHVAYLGYMRRDKGFFFLLDALEGMPPGILGRLTLTVAAQTRDGETTARLQALASRLSGLRHIDGYTRDTLDSVLDTVDLGLVPVLWEDNLPQVAMEMHARRIPLLTSNRGGARELGNCPDLVFEAGDAADFARRLTRIITHGIDLGPYWADARPLLSPEEHADALLDLYRQLIAGEPID